MERDVVVVFVLRLVVVVVGIKDGMLVMVEEDENAIAGEANARGARLMKRIF